MIVNSTVFVDRQDVSWINLISTIIHKKLSNKTFLYIQQIQRNLQKSYLMMSASWQLHKLKRENGVETWCEAESKIIKWTVEKRKEFERENASDC